MQNNTKFVSLLLYCLFQTVCLQAFATSNCLEIGKAAEGKILNLEKQISSLRFLLEKEGAPILPLELVFQIDVKDQEQVSRRLKEVRNFSTIESVLKSRETEGFAQCNSDPKFKVIFQNVSERIANLNSLKLKFFEFPIDKRAIFVDNYTSQRVLRTNKNSIEQDVQETETALNDAQNKLGEASEDLADGTSQPNDEDLAVAVTSLQQYLADYASEHLDFLKTISEKKEKLENIRFAVSESVKKEQEEVADIRSILADANTSWEKTVDFISELFKGIEVNTRVDLPEPMAPKSSFSKEQSIKYSEYLKEFNKSKSARIELAQKRTQIINDLRSQAFQLLSESGQLRSRLFLKCDKADNCNDHRGLNSKNLSDFAREVEIIPIKIQAGAISKAIEFKGKVSAGVDGWIDLFQQIIALFILLLIPLTLLKLLNWFSGKLDSTRKSILNRSMMDFRKRTSIALWITRLNPFIPTVGMAFGIWLARQLIETTDISELSQLLFYFQLYFIYRIFRTLLQISLEVLFASESISDLKIQRIKVESSANRISRLIFIEYAFLFLIESTARKALIYGLLSTLVFYFNIIFIFWESYRWNRQILDAYETRFPAHSIYLRRLSSSKILYFFTCPALFGTVALHDLLIFIYSYLIKLDFFKKIHSEIFRRRIEADAEDQVKLSPSEYYLRQFDYYLPAEAEILVKRENSPAERIKSIINSWRSGKTSEDLVIIVGNRGMGKTTVLNSIAKSIGEQSAVARPPAKTVETQDFFKFLSETLGSEVDSIDALLKVDKDLSEKKIVLIDDIQNVFLGKIGGFEVYKTFVEILSLKTKNIFWCLSVNSRSWSYLKGALGHEHLYGAIIELSSWRDSEIQDLILKRHEVSGVSRQFDKSIKAYGATGDALGQQAETQFFRLLWGQSRGNPRSALMYWISAISQTDAGNIVVGVPSFVNSSLVSTMSDESLFLLASIARHESLTQSEMRAVTRIQNSVIRKCMKEALDKDLVWVNTEGRYRISSRAQYVIDYFLIGKNFLYE